MKKEAWKLLAKSKRVKRMEKVRRFIYYSLSTAALVFLMIKGFGYYEERVEKANSYHYSNYRLW